MNKSKALLVLVAGAMTFTACKKEGCTDELASNYSEEAKKDDGSCVYIDTTEAAPTTYQLQTLMELYSFLRWSTRSFGSIE